MGILPIPDLRCDSCRFSDCRFLIPDASAPQLGISLLPWDYTSWTLCPPLPHVCGVWELDLYLQQKQTNTIEF